MINHEQKWKNYLLPRSPDSDWLSYNTWSRSASVVQTHLVDPPENVIHAQISSCVSLVQIATVPTAAQVAFGPWTSHLQVAAPGATSALLHLPRACAVLTGIKAAVERIKLPNTKHLNIKTTPFFNCNNQRRPP